MYGIDKSLILHLKVSDKLKVASSLIDTIDDAQRTSNNGHKGRVVSILYAFIYHVESVSVIENMPDKDKISSSIQAIVGFIDLVY